MIALWLLGCVVGEPAHPDEALVRLGEALFHETALSADGNLSCASCHDPQRAFTDGEARPLGVTGERLPRNTPTLLNVGQLAPLTWAHPGLYDLAAQAFLPLYGDDPPELGATPDRVVAAMPADLHRAAFGWVPPRAEHARLALAAWQGTLVAPETAWDRWLAGEDALTAEQRLGLALFEDLGCVTCHAGPLLTVADRAYEGPVGPFQPSVSWDEGDLGLFEHTGDPHDRGRFRVPSLRAVGQTAPYFHDGRLPTLSAVVSAYDEAGQLGLTAEEQAALVAWLEAL